MARLTSSMPEVHFGRKVLHPLTGSAVGVGVDILLGRIRAANDNPPARRRL